MSRRKGITYCSEEVAGTKGNWDVSVRFDVTDGHVGISRMDREGDRVLLTPAQFKALVAFVAKP